MKRTTNSTASKSMSKRLIALVISLLLIFSLAACGQNNSTPEEKESSPAVTVDNRSDAEKYRDDAIREYEAGYPYVSVVAFDEETRAELEAIPEKFAIYKENFDVEFENPSELTEMLVTAALSDSKYDRHSVAGRSDCPTELLIKIAKDEPDMVVRFRALGNLLCRDLTEEELLDMVSSEYPKTRLIAVMHHNRTPAVISVLMDDIDPLVKEEINKAISEI